MSATSRGGWFGRSFGVDLRSLALFRIVIAGFVLIDLAERARDLTAHYSETGILPRAGADLLWPALSPWSLHYQASGSEFALVLLFLTAALFGLMLLLGWQTRIATIASWLLLTSLHRRNPLLNFGADQVLAMMLFWGMFLPLGARASLDALRRRTGERPQSHHYVSVATVALLLQIAFVYWFSVARRTTPTWWHGEAMHYALHLDLFARQAALWLREMTALQWLLPVLTWATLLIETVGAVIVFSPWATGWLRLLAIFLFASMHVNFGIFLDLGLFPWISIASWLPFLPAEFWRLFEKDSAARFRAERTAPDVKAPSRAVAVVVAASLLLIIGLNFRQAAIPGLRALLPDSLFQLSRQLRIYQPWAMFTPHPPIEDGWVVLAARRSDGSDVDLLTGGPVSWQKPPLVTATFPNHRWNVYFHRIVLPAHRPLIGLGKRRLCEEWADGPLESLRVYWLSERTVGPGQPQPKAKPLLLYELSCRP